MNEVFEMTECWYCDNDENGYCWGYGLPIEQVEDCEGAEEENDYQTNE